jgi:putative Mg2+ transporter-C (MgtC) family protein
MNLEFIPEDLLKILLAVIVGAIIGAEREYRNKSAGFRTVMLITLGSAIFTILSQKIAPANPDRIAANIVTGIGFLGAGAIFREENRMSGLTTAASIWSAAALGMSIGSGHYVLAIGGMFLILTILFALISVERFIDKKNRVRNYKIICVYRQETLQHYEDLFDEYGLKHLRGVQSRIGNQIIGNWTIMGAEDKHEKLIQVLLSDADVKEFDF